MKQLFSFAFYFLCLSFTQAQGFKLENGQLQLPAPIVFETGSDKIKPESDLSLIHIKQFLDSKTYITLIRIEGHTDKEAKSTESQILSEKRALAVARALVAKGVDCKRLMAVGFGSTKPRAANDTPEGKAQNRRIEIHMAALRGKSIGGMSTDGGGHIAGDTCQ